MKIYFVFNSQIIQLPSDFINSKNDKWIHIFSCKLIDIPSGKLLMDISLHGDIIHAMRDCDSFIMFCNEANTREKKYQQLYNQRDVSFWFEDMTGTKINMDNIKFIIQGMFEWSDE
jgi:hypothetical protein